MEWKLNATHKIATSSADALPFHWGTQWNGNEIAIGDRPSTTNPTAIALESDLKVKIHNETESSIAYRS